MVVLSKKSWHYWLYRQFFNGWRDTKIDNLCPYFWKVVLCVIIFIPSVILALPALVCLFFIGEGDEDREPLGDTVGKGFAVWVSIGLLAGMVGTFFTHNEAIKAIGMVGWTITGVIILGLIISAISSSIEDKSTLVGEFMKAKKNKYCPKIQWKDNEGVEVLQDTE